MLPAMVCPLTNMGNQMPCQYHAFVLYSSMQDAWLGTRPVTDLCCFPGEAPLGQSPRQFSLQKALDKVLKRVGAKDKERPSDGGYATAEDSDTVSRRSSIASLTEPPVALHGEPHGAASVKSAQDRHRIMPGWQPVSIILLADCCSRELLAMALLV